eukprot:TRINITY_DN11192_c0_g1_i2.p1 TRINITY_DN11192_c0_g1~~TRINITY_DN11192_c0_g1_i2.p1  ORF type:complete len:540 (+),score=78.71 TRINITY_DN11192_c0_g1_i2:95-1621(+)
MCIRDRRRVHGNFIQGQGDLDMERKKNENIGIELINVMNENKALHDEINDIYKKSGSTNDENARFINKIDRLEKDNHELREALIFSKAEIERLKTEMIKFDILEKQYRLDFDTKKVEVEQGMLEFSKQQTDELKKNQDQMTMGERMSKEQQMLWQSQKMELQQKVKLYQRKMQELEERINELVKGNEELSTENTRLTLQVDEMRSVYRGKLLNYMNSQIDGPSRVESTSKLGFNMNAREELIRTYNEKEVDQNERLDHEHHINKQLRQEVRAVKNYARNIKYLAEDWAPVGVPLPDILTRPAPVKLEDETMGPVQRDQESEIENLKRRNRKLEEEIQSMQNQMLSHYRQPDHQNQPENFDYRLANEIKILRGNQESRGGRPQSSSLEFEKLKKERNQLQEENRGLVGMLKDNKKWDIYLLLRENEQIKKTLTEYQTNDSVAPISGDTRNLKQKIQFYEKTIKQLEKERSELIVRSTMAEEQLKSLQEHLSKSTADYQKKILQYQKKNF